VVEDFVNSRSVTKLPPAALFCVVAKRPEDRGLAVRERFPLHARKLVAAKEPPGAFQCMLLRAVELPKHYRDVLLLKEVQGHSLAQIAAILGISIDTAWLRLQRARREIGHLGDSDAMEHAQ
jgi:DNA-directed RNA polymerase specialized sigma24 family protein